MSYRSFAPAVVVLLALASRLPAEVTVEPSHAGALVRIDGQFFAEYVTRSGNKPIVWPIVGPTGVAMTRSYPMLDDVPDEKHDHPHHRSLWFTHGDVNGISFWHEGEKTGEIVHREFVKREGGPVGRIVTRNDWIGPDGKRVLQDERSFTFGTDGEARYIDMDVTLKASDGPVTFGDTKEGSGGVRVAGPLKVDAKQGGAIVNANGLRDGEAWGKQAPWVDYHGPLGGQTVGIAIMNHPSSYRFPTYWHVRTYGLFTANPWGVRDFTGDKNADGGDTLPAGQSITLRYRIYLHAGDEKEGHVAEAYERYAK